MANAHSHAFQLDLRGIGERVGRPGDDFWSWRTEMYRLAGSHDPDSMRAVGDRVYGQMAAAGYGAVGEFHYVHHQPDGTPYDEPNAMAIALAEAAVAAGLEITLLPAAYHRAGWAAGSRSPPAPGQVRFCDPSVEAFLERVDGLREWAAGRRRGLRRGGGAQHAGGAGRLARGDRAVRRAPRARPPRARLRAAPRARGDRRRARVLADRAAGPDRLPRPAHERDPRDPRRRPRRAAAGRVRLDRRHLSDDRGQPRRRRAARTALPRRGRPAGDRHR